MARYCVNKNAQANGDHEVHREGCRYLPKEENQRDLGDFFSCRPAVTEAKKYYQNANGCYYCSNDCHTT